MRVTNQITFTAKDDAEALRLAAERLGRDAVILSTQVIKEGGVLGMFKRSVLKVTAGILEDDDTRPQSRPRQQPTAASAASTMDEDTRRENLIAFQKLMEFKERSGNLSQSSTSEPPAPLGEEGYRLPQSENIQISPEGLRNAYGLTTRPAPVPPPLQTPAPKPQPQVQTPPQVQAMPDNETRLLRDQVGALADRIDILLQRITAVENGVSVAVQQTQQRQ